MTAAVDTKKLEDLGLIRRPEPKKQDLGQDDFLALMTAQLQNQDPLKPMQNGEFLGQIAQFSQVRGIQNLESTFNKLADSLYSNQAFQAANLVGKSVVVPSTTIPLTGTQPAQIVVPLSGSAEQLAVEIKNDVGQVIRRLEVKQPKAGDVRVAWDGKDAHGLPVRQGTYSIKSTAMVGGKSYGMDTWVSVPVQSVSLGQGGKLNLNLLGLGAREFSQVRTIES